MVHSGKLFLIQRLFASVVVKQHETSPQVANLILPGLNWFEIEPNHTKEKLPHNFKWLLTILVTYLL